MKVLLYLGNQLSKHGFTPTSVETLGERLKENYHVIMASSKRNMAFRMLHMWYMVIKHRKADYILIDTYSTSAFFFAWTSAKLARCFGLSYIPILHGGALPERAKKSPKRLKKYLVEAHEVICPSPYLKIEMEKIIPLKYQVIPNALDIEVYSFKNRVELPQKIQILWVRSFHEIYNPELAVRLVKNLQELGQNVSLCMVGPDKDGSAVQAQKLAMQLGVEDQLKITGKLSQGDWLKLSTEYDVFINTTNVDNTPVSVLEAMALGLPVISTNVGGLPYLLEDGENALLVPPNDVDSFAVAILSLRQADLYKKLSSKGRKRAEEYAWSHVSSQWKSILR